MTTSIKQPVRPRREGARGRTVIYRGIEIPPLAGKRSPLGKVVRNALKQMKQAPNAEPAHR
jgi:hypothetical protein